MGAGIVITGGMSQLIGIKELASNVFENIPVKISSPVNIKNSYVNFEDPTMSTIVGLLLYGLDTNVNFELDSNKKLRQRVLQTYEQPKIVKTIDKQNETSYVETEPTPLSIIPKSAKKKGVSKFWNKVSEWF